MASFDVALSIYNYYVKPTHSDLFSFSDGFKWDKDYLVPSERRNKNLFIPSLWDPKISGYPSSFIQSGYGDFDHLKLRNIEKTRSIDNEEWRGTLNHGTYFVETAPYFLYSSESSILQLGTRQTEDERSLQPLMFTPKPGIPISASTLKIDSRSGLTVDRSRLKKVYKFTGIIANGIELETENLPENIDQTQLEFKVIYNANNIFKNFKIPVIDADPSLYSFTLPKVPKPEYSLIFTRKDIFKQQKVKGTKYLEGTYGEIIYGEGIENPGDYTVDYETGEIEVYIDETYLDMGYVTFTHDYPAIIEFNNDYLKNKGSEITTPIVSDLDDLDEIGISTGRENQKFTLDEFPVLDISTEFLLDQSNFNLFVYDESFQSFDLDWIRVRDLNEYGPEEKVYELNADKGRVSFGDGVHGRIPPKYYKILAGYNVTLRIEYEPISSIDYWIDKKTDLNLNKNSLSSGFLYLSRKELIPDNITLEFLKSEITSLDFSDLKATVRDVDGELIPDLELEIQIIDGAGNLDEEIITTDSNGVAKTTYFPSARIEDMGIFSQLFEEGTDPGTIGVVKPGAYNTTGSNPNDMLLVEQNIVDSPNDVYVFKIYDDEDQLYNPYNHQTRSGGYYQVLYRLNPISGLNELVKPVGISGNVLVFDESLPQPYNVSDPNYEPDLRGFVIIGRKLIKAKASAQIGDILLESDVATLRLGFSPIQKGEWTLPILPTTYTGSEISRATYIRIN